MVALKLIFRSWWRNKLFAAISILGLAIGIACTNLLAAFVVYEYNIEAENPEKGTILFMSQDSPMKSGETVSYISGHIPAMLEEKYPEVEDYLRIQVEGIKYTIVGRERFDPLTFITADASFPRFFPCRVVSGDLNEALTQPGNLALTETAARRLFGDADPVGRSISFQPAGSDMVMAGDEAEPKVSTYRIAAVVKEREQSFLRFEAIGGNADPFYGGITFLKAHPSIDLRTFPDRLQKDGVPTLQMEKGQYHFSTLRESYLTEKAVEEAWPVNHRQPALLYTGLISALLILLIACFNYVNLNFSRLLQQSRAIHIQKLMGATTGNISRQLFMDTFLTVFIAFLLSLLIMHDILPAFNALVSGRLRTSFFFDRQVFPLMGGFVLFLSVIPAAYMSFRMRKRPHQDDAASFVGKRRQGVTAVLSVAQFAVSIALVMATLTVSRQTALVRDGGKGYHDLIEVGDWTGDNAYILPFVRELRTLPAIKEVTATGGTALLSTIAQIIVRSEDGSESYYSKQQFTGNADYLSVFGIEQLSGIPPGEALKRYAAPVYINETFAAVLVPPGENPVGNDLKRYDPTAGETVAPIAGVVRDFHTASLQEEISPAVIHIKPETDGHFRYASIRLGEDRAEGLAAVRRTWEKYHPGGYFTYRDVYQDYLKRNGKTFELSYLLLVYALISLFLTCFGLFGMALYATGQRTKEIGIRKINGATAWQIMLLLNRRFAAWIAIAFVIALPVTWLLLNRWLEHFAYRVDLRPETFLLAALSVTTVTLLTVTWHSYKAASANPVETLNRE
ncbi:MAG: ABC transporter permease [Tannerellaceae bacterium]|jgi:hypothetical protein|nr:ABC transporter permease [Tannerellaceae bacterium]